VSSRLAVAASGNKILDRCAQIKSLPGHLDFAHGYAARAMAALFEGDRRLHDRWLADAQQSLAWALSSLTDHLERGSVTPTDWSGT
jgi:hypothetical protein